MNTLNIPQNKIITEIIKIMQDSLQECLPQLLPGDLEGAGAVFYMNGKNGTEFDWYVNDKLSDFMIFYNDKDNLGAIKTTLYCNGTVLSYVYGDQGKTLVQELTNQAEASWKEIQSLAALLRNEADDKRIWDADIEKINTGAELSEERLREFLSNKQYYEDIKVRKLMLGQIAYVSRKILDEGWKVGYMCRDEALRDNDSGWSFMAGSEDDEFISDHHNIALMSIHEVMQLDRAVWKYISEPEGTRLIRISSDEFEPDSNDKEIFMERRNPSSPA